VLLVAAAGLGLAIGDMGPKPAPVRGVAPTNQPINRPPTPKMDSFPFVPGRAPPTAAPAPR
jgi:hypothetical protein